MIRIGPKILHDFAKATSREWLQTNGLGGYASSTLAGANTRKYHGLMVATGRPPSKRMVMLSKLEETLILQKERHELSCNQYQGVVHPEGFRYLKEFRLDPFPTFTYEVNGAVLEKTVFMVHGENTTIITYELVTSPGGAACLLIRPLLACRDYHSVSYENQFFDKRVETKDGLISMKPYDISPTLYLSHNADQFEPSGYWYRNFEYTREFERGLESYEDLYSPGHLVYLLREGEKGVFVASLSGRLAHEAELLEKKEEARQRKLEEAFKAAPEYIRSLAKASDSFLVRREGAPSSVIAGYHWFTEWSRDTLISLPGLTLVAGRYDVARAILQSYARYCDRGLMPTYFPDTEELPEYTCVDSSLWYFYAVGKYLEYTRDMAFVKKYLLSTLLEIMDYYIRGTRHGIHMDKAGLITFSERRIPLTWMDTMVKEGVVTPRHGKVVEVNALWYNALRVMEQIISEFDIKLKREYAHLAQVVKNNFTAQFWNESKGYLYDWIDDGRKNSQLRPNQLLALSLPFTMLPKVKASRVLDAVHENLYTLFGLRSLSPEERGYIGHYAGDQYSRDRAYHHGTVWPWFIGPFVTAYLKVNGRTKKTIAEAEELLAPFADHLEDAGLETISEIFDGDPPHTPRGCIAQAFSVAEILRAYAEDIKALKPVKESYLKA